MPAYIQGFINVLNHNQQHHIGRSFVLLGIAILLVPAAAFFSYLHMYWASHAAITAALFVEIAAVFQNFCPCGCSKKTRELSKLTPSKESRRLSQLEGRKALLRIVPIYLAMIALVVLPIPKPIIIAVMLALSVGFGVFLLYFGINKKCRRLLARPTLLRYKDLTVHDFADWSDKELEDLIKFGLMTGALDGANLVSKFVLKKTEMMYISDSETNGKQLQPEAAPEAGQASAA